MILINIYFAETDHYYDFKVDEDSTVAKVIDEAVILISQSERIPLGKKSTFLLCDKKSHSILSAFTTMAQNGVVSGSELLLI